MKPRLADLLKTVQPRRGSLTSEHATFDALAASFLARGFSESTTRAIEAWGAMHDLPFLGRGSERAVFAVSGGALKLVYRLHVLPPEEENANLREARAWHEAMPRLRPLLVPVLATALDGRWLLMERVTVPNYVDRFRLTPDMERTLWECGVEDYEFGNVATDGRVLDYANLRGSSFPNCWRRNNP